MTSPADPSYDVEYPPAPWNMVGQLWLSLFRLREPVDELRPAGLYGAAFVSYEAGSPLTYSELLVARPVRPEGGSRAVSITDIWVDSPASVAGGRGLWAIPKGLCDFTLESSYRGPVTRTEWSSSIERQPVAHARFTDVSRAALRTPFRGSTWQPPIDDHVAPATAQLRGSGKALPCRGTWEFAPDGPLGWLAGHRPLVSFRMAGFRMSFA
ncbi:acetoacetate decarboxylase family protein [Nocardioides dongkuii]|uniref:acetoacetate decarboxylase family protein n=1 Tax=Nocardioides dongkuii TaxID=2760089 RepID=UPI0018776781|nr:acetoacetate decarboxylase family protein [Nocardioides dongkuii]